MTGGRAAPPPVGRGHRLPHGDAGRPRRLRRDLARLDQRLHPPAEPARDPRRPRRDPPALRPPPGDRPRRVRRRRAGGRWRTAGGRGVHRLVPARGPVVPLDAVRAAGGPGAAGWAGRCSRRSCRRAGQAALATSHGQRPADLERAVRVARDRAADAAPPARRAGRAGRPPAGRCRDGVEAVPFDAIVDGRGGRPPGRRADRDSTGRRRASSISWITASSGPRAGPASSSSTAAAGAVGYGYASEAGRVGPIAVRDAALLGPGRSATCPDGRARAARSGSGCRARRARRSSAAAPGRLPDRRLPVLLCWDRPFADFSRYAADLAGPPVAPTRRRRLGRRIAAVRGTSVGFVPVPGRW